MVILKDARWLALAVMLGWVDCGLAVPVISEFLADNVTGIADRDGLRGDWIEIHNPSAVQQAMGGWYLTDDVGLKTKWQFPAVVIEPGGFLLVWATGKNRRVAGEELHTNFSLKKDGEYLGLVQPDGATVAQEFSPAYAEQTDDRSFGLLFNRETLLAVGAGADYRVPTGAGDVATDWKSGQNTPAGWTLNRPTGIGMGLDVPGMVITIRSQNVATGSIQGTPDALRLLGRPAGHADIAAEHVAIIPTFNVLGNGSDGHYGNNRLLPPGIEEQYVCHGTGTLYIPTAGPWTFGINSDDGGRIVIDGNVVVDDPTAHGAQDHLGTVTLTAGPHSFEVFYWESWGGDEGEFFAGAGTSVAWHAGMRLVGDTPNGGLAVTTPAPQVGATGLQRTSIESALRGVNSSVLFRSPFAGGAGASGFTSLSLVMRYGDGFSAWLNGQPIAASGAPAALVWNAAAMGTRTLDDVMRPVAYNITQSLPSLRAGANVLAVHGLNDAVGDGLFLYLPEVLAATLPPDRGTGFFNAPTPLGINGAPDSLGKVADTVFLPRRGVYPDAVVTAVPFPVTISCATPGVTIRYTLDGSEPTATTGLVYTGPLSITQSVTLRALAVREGWESTNVDTHTYILPADVIRQSPTGLRPNAAWPLPDVNGDVFGQAVQYGMDPEVVDHVNGAVGGAGQVVAALRAIPSVNITMAQADLFDDEKGIYVNPYGRGLTWERRCSVELLNDEEGGFQIDAGIRLRGGYSRDVSNPKHAFHLYFRGDYGKGRLEYPLFGVKGAESFNQLDLRTSQNYSWAFSGDGNNTFLREEFARQTQLDMGHAGSRVKYLHLYLNGHYWGLYNTDERTEADHCTSYLGGEKLNWDVIKHESVDGYAVGATDGNLGAWHELFTKANPYSEVSGVRTRRALTAAEYYELQGLAADGVTRTAAPVLLDVDNLIDYMLITFWTGNTDGATSAFLGNLTANNWFGARDRTGTRGFDFFVHDFEHSLFSTGEDRTGPFVRVFTNEAEYVEKRRFYNPMFVHADMMDVPAYKARWQTRVQRHLYNGGTLSQQSVTARLNALAAVVDKAIIAESARWGDAQTEPPRTRANWQSARDQILNQYFPQRTSRVLAQLRADGLYPDSDGVNVTPEATHITSTTPVNMTTAGAGTIYYTLDGTDPMRADGSVDPAARIYIAPGVNYDTLVGDGVSNAARLWKYREPSADLGSSGLVIGHPSYGVGNWKHPNFNDGDSALWKDGAGELGAGDGGERTVIDIGPSAMRYPVVYFRRKFNVTGLARYDGIELEGLIDDGAIVYLNGREVARIAMPSGEVGYAYTPQSAVNEAVFLPITGAALLPNALVEGENTIAVEVHQQNAASSDLSFDLRLRGRRLVTAEALTLRPGKVVVRARVYNAGVWSALGEREYVVDAEPATALNIVVSEVQYFPGNITDEERARGFDDDTFFEYIELMNIGTRTVDLLGLRFTSGVTWAFGEAADVSRFLSPGQKIVVAGNSVALQTRWGASRAIAGQFQGQLSNSGERLAVVNASGDYIKDFSYSPLDPWPVGAAGTGPALVLRSPTLNPAHGLAGSWTATAAAPLSFDAWRQANAPGQATESDSDGDGVSLLWEYAFAGNPAQKDVALMPRRNFQTTNNAVFQTLTFQLRIGASDLDVQVEQSSDLASWQSGQWVPTSRTPTAAGIETLVYRSPVAVTGAPQQFVRLRATLR